MAKGGIGDLLVSSCFKGRTSGKAIGDCQTGEHKNPLYPFNVAPINPYYKINYEINDYWGKCALKKPLKNDM